MRLINVLVERLAQLEGDPTKRSVLMLLRKRPEHLGLLKNLYFEEQQAPVVQRQHEMVATDQPDGTLHRIRQTTITTAAVTGRW
jgi:hypothetical protein